LTPPRKPNLTCRATPRQRYDRASFRGYFGQDFAACAGQRAQTLTPGGDPLLRRAAVRGCSPFAACTPLRKGKRPVCQRSARGAVFLDGIFLRGVRKLALVEQKGFVAPAAFAFEDVGWHRKAILAPPFTTPRFRRERRHGTDPRQTGRRTGAYLRCTTRSTRCGTEGTSLAQPSRPASGEQLEGEHAPQLQRRTHDPFSHLCLDSPRRAITRHSNTIRSFSFAPPRPDAPKIAKPTATTTATRN